MTSPTGDEGAHGQQCDSLHCESCGGIRSNIFPDVCGWCADLLVGGLFGLHPVLAKFLGGDRVRVVLGETVELVAERNPNRLDIALNYLQICSQSRKREILKSLKILEHENYINSIRNLAEAWSPLCFR